MNRRTFGPPVLFWGAGGYREKKSGLVPGDYRIREALLRKNGYQKTSLLSVDFFTGKIMFIGLSFKFDGY